MKCGADTDAGTADGAGEASKEMAIETYFIYYNNMLSMDKGGEGYATKRWNRP